MDDASTRRLSYDELADIVERALAEGRPVPSPAELGVAFDEAWYLRSNADIAQAVADGRCLSPLQHYLRHGHKVGRRPVPPKRDDPRSSQTGPADPESGLDSLREHHRNAQYLCPTDLRQTPLAPRRLMMIGSCFLGSLGFARSDFADRCTADFLLANHASKLPDAPDEDPASYDLQLVQMPLRTIMHDALLWHIPFSDPAQHEVAFDKSVERMAIQLDALLAWNVRFGIPTLVMNFLVPQENPLGKLLPRYDLRNPMHFVERLNIELERLLHQYNNVYLLDVDKIAASLGRRYVQDDTVAHFAHNAMMFLPGEASERIEPLAPMSEYYDIAWWPVLRDSVWEEVVAIYRTIRQADAVKLVVVDLDDTLWSGVIGEMESVGPEMIEGWPLGIAEAMAYLKKRGVLLAILSKNDDARVAERWDEIFRGRLRLQDFATRRINWQPKTANMQEILADVNLLPRNVLFVDDNPVERKAMKQAFPEMRVIGRHPYYLRRIMLWSPETQVAAITDESSRRTELIHSRIEREQMRTRVSREVFLASLEIRVDLYQVDARHPRYQRVFELLNKTNQFNTTGKRWKPDELSAALLVGSELYAFEVSDRDMGHGLVGVLIVDSDEIVQFVMSCRVVGLDVELAALAAVVRLLRGRGVRKVRARFMVTEANLLCRDLFRNAGFERAADGWELSGDGPSVPTHIRLDAAVPMLSA